MSEKHSLKGQACPSRVADHILLVLYMPNKWEKANKHSQNKWGSYEKMVSGLSSRAGAGGRGGTSFKENHSPCSVSLGHSDLSEHIYLLLAIAGTSNRNGAHTSQLNHPCSVTCNYLYVSIEQHILNWCLNKQVKKVNFLAGNSCVISQQLQPLRCH